MIYKIYINRCFITFLLGITLIVSFAYSQKIEENEKLRENSVKVFIKCSVCDMDFMRDEIQFVNYVRIQEDADVYIYIINCSINCI
jgi:hypothetical protein